jgi:hypothetical protein
VSTVCSGYKVVGVHCVQDAELCEFILFSVLGGEYNVFRVLSGVSTLYSGC